MTPRFPKPTVLLIIVAGLALIAGLAACAGAPAETAGMTTLEYPWQAGNRQNTLLVLLPGINNSPSAFSAAGMVAAAQARAQVDVLAVDASLRYYIDRSVVDRLHDEVLMPAKAHGYHHIWLIGASMGAFGALLYVQLHPEEIDGLVLLAPFLGQGSLQKELQAAGGLASWHYQPGSGQDEQDRKVREIWHLLQQSYSPGTRESPELPEIWLGWGDRDTFWQDATALAAIMPASHVLTIPGQHNWKTWAALFQELLPRLGLPQP